MICEKRRQYIRPKKLVAIHTLHLEELVQLIQNNPNPSELKRALAVQMTLQGYAYREICGVLQVSVGFISKWKLTYQEQGISGLKLKHRGPASYLDPTQKQAALCWLKQKNCWNLLELQQHIQETYNVVFASKQSYYGLFKEAGIAWKKSNPNQDSKQPRSNRRA